MPYRTSTSPCIEILESRIAPAFAAALDVAALSGQNGFTFNGVPVGPGLGGSMDAAGDMNNDGIEDFIIGAPYSSGSEVYDLVYVVFGTASGFAASFDLSSLDGTNGFRIKDQTAVSRLGASVSAAGDVNNDGIDDVVIGGSGFNVVGEGSNAGVAYVIFGKSTPYPAELSLSDLDNYGFAIFGEDGGNLGTSVNEAGDVNGDGYDDVILGAPDIEKNGTDSGGVYVVFGSAGTNQPSLSVKNLNGTNGFKMYGEAALDRLDFGQSVGDIDGDGADDFLVQAGALGDTYLIYGKAAGFSAELDLATLTPSQGMRIGLGLLESAGDINGDGNMDLFGTFRASGFADPLHHQGHVIFGTATGFDFVDDISELDGTNGFVLKGAIDGTYFGVGTLQNAAAGDLNDDGYDDLVIGESLTAAKPSAAYVFFGRPTQYPPVFHMEDLNGTNGFRMTNSLTAVPFGSRSAGIGDVNDDGFEDLIVGNSGAAFVVLGNTSDPLVPTIRITGTTIVEVDQGTATATFTVRLSEPSLVPVSVQYSTADGTATATSGDYAALTPQTLTFAPGELEKTIQVLTSGDIDVEDTETFFVNLSDPNNGIIGTAQATATILTDDVALAFNKNFRKVTFTDQDGDIITATTTKGAFDTANFIFEGQGRLLTIDLAAAGTLAAFEKAIINISAKKVKRGTGDGLIALGTFDGAGVDILDLTVKGSLTAFLAGDADDTTPGLRNVIVNSLGDPAALTPAVSAVTGAMGKLTVKGDVDHLNLFVSGNSAPAKQSKATALNSVSVAGSVRASLIGVGFDTAGDAVNPDVAMGVLSVKSWNNSSLTVGIEDTTGNGFGLDDQRILGGGSPDIIAKIANVKFGAALGTGSPTVHAYGIVAEVIGQAKFGKTKVPLTKNIGDDLLPPGVGPNLRFVEVIA